MGCLLEMGFLFDVVWCVLCDGFWDGMRNERNEMEDFGLDLKGWKV